MDLGRYGIFLLGTPTPEEAARIESLGYGTIWAAGSPAASLDWVEPLLEVTGSVKLGTAIVNVWSTDPAEVAESFHRIEAAHPGRFVLGIGAGHPEVDSDYRSPLRSVSGYLDSLDRHDVPVHRRLLAALGPRMLELAGRRAAGAIPYLTTVEHTAWARTLLGPNAILAPEHKVVLGTNIRTARAAGRSAFRTSIQKANYQSSWRRLGFTETDITDGGSDRLVDAMITHGTPETVIDGLDRFHRAGADHVPIQLLVERVQLIPALAELARAGPGMRDGTIRGRTGALR